MRRSAAITLEGEEYLLNEIYEKIKEDANKAEILQDMLQISIYEDTKGYQILMEEIREKKIFHTFFERRYYTKEEMNIAKFYLIIIMDPWGNDAISASDFGTKYSDEKACVACGFGKEQISDLIIDKRKAKKYDICNIHPEIIVNERFYNLILENNLTGCSFDPVHDSKGKDETPFYQLKVTNVLPEMSNKARIDNEGTCNVCKRSDLYLKSEGIYESSSLADACDFNLTNEFLFSEQERFLILSAKAYHLFEKNKIKGVAFEPVAIVEQ